MMLIFPALDLGPRGQLAREVHRPQLRVVSDRHRDRGTVVAVELARELELSALLADRPPQIMR